MSTHSAEFGSGPLSPEEIARAAEEREDDRRASSGDHYRPVVEFEGAPSPSTELPVTQPTRRARRTRPRLPDFTGTATRDENVYDPEEVVPDDPEADRAARRERVKSMITEVRAKLDAASDARPSSGFRYTPPVTPAELAQQGPVTSYVDAHGYDVFTLRDPRDPNQRYDPKN